MVLVRGEASLRHKTPGAYLINTMTGAWKDEIISWYITSLWKGVGGDIKIVVCLGRILRQPCSQAGLHPFTWVLRITVMHGLSLATEETPPHDGLPSFTTLLFSAENWIESRISPTSRDLGHLKPGSPMSRTKHFRKSCLCSENSYYHASPSSMSKIFYTLTNTLYYYYSWHRGGFWSELGFKPKQAGSRVCSSIFTISCLPQ